MFSFFVYLYYWVLVHSEKLLKKIFLNLVPQSVIEDFIRDKFQGWGIKVSNEKSAGKALDKKKFQCEIVIKDRRFYRRLATDISLGLAESYMDGWYDSDDLFLLFTILIGNNNDTKKFFGRLDKLFEAKNMQTRDKATDTIEIHYDLGNDLYKAMLDKSMNYTCAYWPGVEDDDNLDQAQINKMELIARKLKLKPGMKVLDLGCGFGSLAKFLAEKYKVSVVGYTISKEQIGFARESCKGLPVEFRLEDYRNAKGIYDRVVSVGFLEHVGKKNLREYFEIANRCLADDGLHLCHSITTRDHTFPRTEEFLQKYIFPGGELPHPEDFMIYSAGLLCVEDVHNFGPSYAKTLLAWKKRFTKNWPAIKDNYDSRFDGKFYKMWIYYLTACAAGFEARAIGLYQVVQTKGGIRGGYMSVR